MENSFRSIIDRSKSVLILLPTRAYFDQVAAGLGLYLALREKKDVQVYSPSPMTVEFNRLIGVNKITGELGSKNLIIRFSDYRAGDIERVSYDIEDGQFRLTVIPKTRISPPLKEQVVLSYSGISAECVILIGGANESHFPAISSKELTGSSILHIGTRDISLSSGKTYVSLAKPASSVSEVVAGLIKESGLAVDEDAATNLLAGIENATNNFTEPGLTADTFALVAELMRSGGKRISGQQAVSPANFPLGSIPGATIPSQQKPVSGQIPPIPQPWQTRIPTQQVQQGDQSQVADNKDEKNEQPPQDWLQPKIYKGTSVS